MAAPEPTVRQTPAGIALRDGFATKITVAADTDISFWEKTVQPPGIDGGDPIDTSTMFNLVWRTMAPRHLKTLTPINITAAYDPNVHANLVIVTNVETTITITFPDGTTIAFYGFVQVSEPQDAEEGSQPEMTVTITPTNWDPVNNVEAGPAIANVSGT